MGVVKMANITLLRLTGHRTSIKMIESVNISMGARFRVLHATQTIAPFFTWIFNLFFLNPYQLWYKIHAICNLGISASSAWMFPESKVDSLVLSIQLIN